MPFVSLDYIIEEEKTGPEDFEGVNDEMENNIRAVDRICEIWSSFIPNPVHALVRRPGRGSARAYIN